MQRNEEIEILERFRTGADWAYMKREIASMQKGWEHFKDQAVSQGDSVRAARILGIIQGLGVAAELPEELLKKKLKPGFMKKAQEVMGEAVESIQSLLKEAFKDFPEKETETQSNGG